MKKSEENIQRIREFYNLSPEHSVIYTVDKSPRQPIEYLDGVTGALLATYRPQDELKLTNPIVPLDGIQQLAQFYHQEAVMNWDQHDYDLFTSVVGPITFRSAMCIVNITIL